MAPYSEENRWNAHSSFRVVHAEKTLLPHGRGARNAKHKKSAHCLVRVVFLFFLSSKITTKLSSRHPSGKYLLFQLFVSFDQLINPVYKSFSRLSPHKVKAALWWDAQRPTAQEKFVLSKNGNATWLPPWMPLNFFLRISMNSSRHCLSNLVWFATIMATYIRAENRRERENASLASDWTQSSAHKRADVDEVRCRPLCPLLTLLVSMSLLGHFQRKCWALPAACSVVTCWRVRLKHTVCDSHKLSVKITQ